MDRIWQARDAVPLSKRHGEDFNGDLCQKIPARQIRELAPGKRLWLPPRRPRAENVRRSDACPRQETNDVSERSC